MRKITSLLMLFCMCVGMAWAAPTDLPEITTDLNNPIYYTIRNTRSTSGKFLYWTENGVKDNNAVFESSLFYITGESLANCKIHNVATNLLFSGAALVHGLRLVFLVLSRLLLIVHKQVWLLSLIILL